MAEVCGSRQKFIKMTLKRMKINESVLSSYESSSESSSTDNAKERNNNEAIQNHYTHKTSKSYSSFSSHKFEEERTNEKENSRSGDSDKNSDAYIIEQDNLYIECKIEIQHQVLQMDVQLDWYPHLKEEIQDIFNIKVSLVDLARELEKDLIIIETQKDIFKLCFKKMMLKGF